MKNIILKISFAVFALIAMAILFLLLPVSAIAQGFFAEKLAVWGLAKILGTAGATIGAIILTWVLKKIPTEKVRNAIYKPCYKAGQLVNDFFKAWKITRGVWHILEPWLVGFLRMIFVTIPEAFFAGMAYDDPPKKIKDAG